MGADSTKSHVEGECDVSVHSPPVFLAVVLACDFAFEQVERCATGPLRYWTTLRVRDQRVSSKKWRAWWVVKAMRSERDVLSIWSSGVRKDQ